MLGCICLYYRVLFATPKWTLYILYLDESGDPQAWEHNNFVLAGVAVHEGQVYQLGKQLDDIQARFFPGRPIPVPFHATDIRAGRGHFGGLDPGRRNELMGAVYSVLSSTAFPFLIAYATTMHVSKAESAQQVLHVTFQDLLQRFNRFLTRQFQHDQPNKGLLVIDQAHQERYRELFADFKRVGTEFQGYLTNIIDVPYFAGRRDTRMMQLADFCAFAVFRHYENNDNELFTSILPRFDRRGPRDPPDGLKHFTRLPCKCEACAWRQPI